MDCINARTRTEYAMIPNALLRDSSLSFKAKGIISLLLSNNDGWKSYKSVLALMSTDGRDSIESGLKELERAEYLKRFTVKDEKKRYAGSVWAYTDVKGDFNIDFDKYTNNGYSIMGKSVNGKDVTKKTNDKKINNKNKKNSSESFQDARERFELYLNRRITDKELESIKMNLSKGYYINALIQDFDEYCSYNCIDVQDIDKDGLGLKCGIVGLIYMYRNDFDMFCNILKSL